ncbi:NADH-quinone oxidoreductase subunit K [Pseudohaliea sp.]|uniref:NADH-quinone oxidoreductase subunit K n=1 Tax=Pseudohaliea sp. TaxID=2740289 RepID=UPI0032F05225
MTGQALYAVLGCALFCLAFHALVVAAHPLRRLLAVNVMGSSVFLVLVAGAAPGDPLPQALVITGIVVAVAATALGLNLLLRLAVPADDDPADGQGGS